MNDYLIPANTNNGKLIFGLFKIEDLILFGVGILITLLLLAFVPAGGMWEMILMLSPALITGFLVVPIPHYHNMLTFIMDAFDFFTKEKDYKWKGWCYKNVSKK